MRHPILFVFLFAVSHRAFSQYDSLLIRKTDTIRYEFVDAVPGIPVIYSYPDSFASYPYGRDSLYKFLRANLPAQSQNQKNSNLTIVVHFTVLSDSTLSNFNFVRGNKLLYEDAVKALEKSGLWIPGTYQSSNVATEIALKIKFPRGNP